MTKELTENLPSSLNGLLKTWRDGIFNKLRVSAPGYIKTYNPATKLADIQLTIKPEINGEFQDPPLLYSVPVRQYNSRKAIFFLAIGEDDPVDVMFADQSLAEHHQEDGKTLIEPEDSQRHNLNNAYAVPRVETAKNGHTIADPTLPGIYLADDAKLFLGRLGGGGEEVLNIAFQLSNTVTELINFMKTTLLIDDSTFKLDPSVIPALIPIEQKLTKIQTDLQSLGQITQP